MERNVSSDEIAFAIEMMFPEERPPYREKARLSNSAPLFKSPLKKVFMELVS